MPNTPALIGQAASAIALGAHATGSHGKSRTAFSM
jgi:pyrroline-5-carboxylate reductase